MEHSTASGHYYRRKLPHYRAPGAVYHVRMHLDPNAAWLKADEEYQIIQDSIFFMHKLQCLVYAYAIMPNHCHMALLPKPKINNIQAWADYTQYHKIESILGSIKKFTARRINRLRGCSGALWQDESFDRIARSEKDLDGLIDYIHGNPERWGLVERPEEYRWSSASTIYSGKEEFKYWFADTAEQNKSEMNPG